MARLARLLVHLLGFAVVCAVAAYWVVRVLTPQPSSAPPAAAAPAPRDPDPVLAARMFGLVQVAAAPVVTNVQVAGVFAAGADSSAVLVVDNQPARAFLLGQEVAPGMRLVEVGATGVTLESAGGRQQLTVAGQPAVAPFAGGSPPVAYTLQKGILSAPSVEGTATRAPVVARPPPPRPAAPPPAPPPAVLPPGTRADRPPGEAD